MVDQDAPAEEVRGAEEGVEEVFEVDVFGRVVVPSGVGEMEAEDLAVALEALCFALNRPVSQAEAAGILGRTPQAVARAGDALAAQLRGRGLMLQRHEDQLQIVTRPEVAWAVQRALNPERPTRLSRAAMETLAIIAYRQPVTRARLEAVRGVNCEAVLEHLENRGLISEVGRQPTPGNPRLFGTTLRFLQVVGLESIADLPALPEGMDVPDLEDERWRGDEASSGAAGREPAQE
jgi:segregation and condensation protein B